MKNIKTYKVQQKNGFGKYFAIIIFNAPRADRIAEAFNFVIGHNAPYNCPLGRGTVFEIIESDRAQALKIVSGL